MSSMGRRVVVGDEAGEENTTGSPGSHSRKSSTTTAVVVADDAANTTAANTITTSPVRRTSSSNSMRGVIPYRKPLRLWLYSRLINTLPAIFMILVFFSFLFSGCLLYVRIWNTILKEEETGLKFTVPTSIVGSIITTTTIYSVSATKTLLRTTGTCDVFNGRWVTDDSYPLYNNSLCPFVERGFNCQANGRNDTAYMKWKWKPRDCDLPEFKVENVLEILKGKRVVFVGDSMSRTQWESMICMLMTGVKDPSTVYEVNKNQISKTIRFLSVRFESFNLTIDFFRSVFLTQQGPAPLNSPKRVKTILKLDKLDDISERWIDSDVIIFNSGQWWTPAKLFEK